MLDAALLEKVKSLITERQRIDRELEAIFAGSPRRGRPRKDRAQSDTKATDLGERDSSAKTGV